MKDCENFAAERLKHDPGVSLLMYHKNTSLKIDIRRDCINCPRFQRYDVKTHSYRELPRAKIYLPFAIKSDIEFAALKA